MFLARAWIMRLFHDEEVVRKNAFDALLRAVDSGVLELDDETLAEVKRRFMKHESDKGCVFEVPNRIDLLRKPA
jgi:hypothetical protein